MDLAWKVGALADFDGDGHTDFLWHDPATGENAMWLRSHRRKQLEQLTEPVDPGWEPIGAADHDGDGRADLLWHEPATGAAVVWLMDGSAIVEELYLGDW